MANTPARAPAANDRAARPTPTSRTTARANAGGHTTANPPAKVRIERPPRKRANSGHACPIIAAATAAYATGTLGPATTPSPAVWAPLTASPSSPARTPFSMSPAKTGAEAREPARSRTFQKPGLRSPTSRGSNPCARATSTATGTEPRR
ncbi:hypothetical protein MPTA5024_40055 [Microbispora sp. ATCC PTA-5024]|nr:hypothetical protein MPTA5024_40055 [Microbispora sp. ATCC PTA-5024]